MTRVVSVTARGGAAEPPLAAVVDPRLVVAGIAVFAVLAAALVAGATRRAFAGSRGPVYRESDYVDPLVDARELFAVYPSSTGGVAALQGLTLSVAENEICVVLGPSGSGKTTLMRVLAGLARPSAGSLVVAGVDLLHASARDLGGYRRDVLGYADQHYWRALAGELTAEELVGRSSRAGLRVPGGTAYASQGASRARRATRSRGRSARPSSREASSSGSRCARRWLIARGS